ncbi:MAG: GHKL domain-containing protein [Oscillospiraceae bacterium]|nr:GHKL domain-containing protein [Oscillospiraceae bacterium]
MGIDWVLIEFLAITAENIAILFFLNSRFKSKSPSQRLWWIFLVISIVSATICKFAGLPFIEISGTIIFFLYLFVAKHGRLLHKIFGVVLTQAILLATSLFGASLMVTLSGVSFAEIALTQNNARLLAIILVTLIQIIAFYALSKKHLPFRNLSKWPTVVLSSAVAIDFICLFLLLAFVLTTELNPSQMFFPTIVSAGLLLITIAIFVLFELFIRDEERSLRQLTQIQRLELEGRFYQEIDAMYADMRVWRHNYKNNLTALRALVAHCETEKALNFIDNVANEPAKNKSTLQTGNLVLDAVVSSKLWLAQSLQIEVAVQAVYPENNPIADTDLCAIAGNLLDNAIEACGRMTESDGKKFIEFILLLKGKNLTLSIRNSFNGEINEKNGKYVSLKQGRFHGIGLSHVESTVAKYHGHIEKEHQNGIFEIRIMLPLSSSSLI